MAKLPEHDSIPEQRNPFDLVRAKKLFTRVIAPSSEQEKRTALINLVRLFEQSGLHPDEVHLLVEDENRLVARQLRVIERLEAEIKKLGEENKFLRTKLPPEVLKEAKRKI